MVLQILVILKLVFPPLLSTVTFFCTSTFVTSGHIFPVLRLLLASCRHLSLLATLLYSADFPVCLLDKILKPKQVWIFSLKTEDLGNSCERCLLHKTLINSIYLWAISLVFDSSAEWWIWGLCLSKSTLNQNILTLGSEREADGDVFRYLCSPGLCRHWVWSWTPLEGGLPEAGLVRRSSAAFYSWRQFCWSCHASPHCSLENSFVSDHLLLRKLPFW